jgi:uncharacterized membrane protein
MPTSPMPATGFTISVPVSQTLELNITMDQAIQFVVSCGVVVPRAQIVGGGNAIVDETAVVKQVVEGHVEQIKPNDEVELANVDVTESGHQDD